MEFELTPELVDQIIFAMENQSSAFYLDSHDLQILPLSDKGDVPDEDHCYKLPGWSSVEGFQVMEQFVGTLRNPIARQELRFVLKSGSGVFRKFKNILHHHPEVEKLWFNFKTKTMRSLVRDWYNQLRDFWGLEHIGEEPEEVGDLLEFDFTYQTDIPLDQVEGFSEGIQSGLDECLYDVDPPQRSRLVEYWSSLYNNKSRLITARTTSGDLAAFLVYNPIQKEQGKIISCNMVYTLEEYRGLGLAGQLIQHFVDLGRALGGTDVVISLLGQGTVLQETLHREGFVNLGLAYVKDLLKGDH